MSRTFTKQTEHFVLVIPALSLLLSLPSLFSYAYSYPLHFPSFTCAMIHCSPSQLLFLPSDPLSSPIFASPSWPSHHTTPPSYILTIHWLAYYTNHRQLWPPAIPDTSTLHYNSWNTLKHTWGLQTQQHTYIFLTHLPLSPQLLVPPLPIAHCL
jgi:hypothetical protein